MKTWTTQFGDVVGVGDLVALSLAGHPDARGVIVGDAGDGRAWCVLTECGRCADRPTVAVEDFNLAMLLKREVTTLMRTDFDDYCR